MAIRHYRLVRNHLGSDRKECLQRNLRRDILYKKKKKERKKERRVTKSLAKDVGGTRPSDCDVLIGKGGMCHSSHLFRNVVPGGGY